MRYLMAILLALSATFVFVDCNSGNCSGGGVCGCNGGPECILDCGNSDHCAPTCSNFGTDCHAICGDDCAVQCNGGPTCIAECGANCRVNCNGATNCATTCGPGCNYSCTSVNACNPTVGAGSTVTCNSVSNCNATCQGTCRVNCSSTGSCNVNCPAGVTKTMCSPTLFTCGEAC
jgi:hypothetical protein